MERRSSATLRSVGIRSRTSSTTPRELASSAKVARNASGSSEAATPGSSAALIVAVAAYVFGARKIPAATALPVITRINATSVRWRQSATPTSRTSIDSPRFAQTTSAQTPLDR